MWYSKAAEQGHNEAQACFNKLQAYLDAKEQRRIIREKQKRKALEESIQEYTRRWEEEKAKEAEIEKKAKDMIEKYGALWWGLGCDSNFVEFVKIAPQKYVRDYLPHMDKSSVEPYAFDIWCAVKENPDQSAQSIIEWELEYFHNYRPI